MLRRTFKLLFPLAIASLVAPLAFGKSVVNNKPGENQPIVKMLKFTNPIIVNGKTMQPAEYRIVAKGNELKVEDLNRKVLAESPITWQQLGHRFKTTKMDIDHGVLTKVDLGNTNEAVLLHNSHSS
jgi:hypothetical protein